MLETVFKKHMESTNFKQCTADPCFFVRSEGTDLTIIAVYVDDLIIITKTPEKMRWIKNSLATRFKMKDLGKLHYCLERYGLSQAKPSTTPVDTKVKLVEDDGVSKLVDPICYQTMVGSLLYAAIATRPDIAQAVGTVSKFNSCPNDLSLS